MSRLGKKPIKIPEVVEAKIKGKILKLKGPKGGTEYKIPEGIKLEEDGDSIRVISLRQKKEDRITYGLSRAAISNKVRGVYKGFKKELELFGVGFSANLEKDELVLTVGYSHPVKIKKPSRVEIKINKNELKISGIDRGEVGQFAAKIHDLKRAEPYKGKGFKYKDEIIKRKVGKTALKAEGETAAK
ncbi:50S ribosomal protein L6 [Patescibacteria group bacterium]|nr:50S ribosomal protein L6 [Patescibacteria group bacterium]